MGHLYALDFDGVLCDTCGETAISALKVLSLSPIKWKKTTENSRKFLMITFSFIWFWTFFGFEISVSMLFDDL